LASPLCAPGFRTGLPFHHFVFHGTEIPFDNPIIAPTGYISVTLRRKFQKIFPNDITFRTGGEAARPAQNSFCYYITVWMNLEQQILKSVQIEIFRAAFLFTKRFRTRKTNFRRPLESRARGARFGFFAALRVTNRVVSAYPQADSLCRPSSDIPRRTVIARAEQSEAACTASVRRGGKANFGGWDSKGKGGFVKSPSLWRAFLPLLSARAERRGPRRA